MGGEFIGERRTDYVATKGERAPVKKPQDHLKPEGEFVRRPKEEAPTRGERAPVRKPQDTLKFEGDLDSKSPRLVRISVDSFSFAILEFNPWVLTKYNSRLVQF